MFQLLGFTIISTKKYNYLKFCEKRDIEATYASKPEPPLNCGYKSCNFQTTSPRGLKLHRTKIHKKR